MNLRLRFPIAACLLLLAASFFPAILGLATAVEDKFNPSCLPYAAIATHHQVDRDCPSQGIPESLAQKKQNIAKNALCALNPAVIVNLGVFDALQQAVEQKHIPFGNQHIHNPVTLSSNRAQLRKLVKDADGADVGEGTKVVFVGFLVPKEHSPGAESVNCNQPHKENNDIHFDLGESSTSDICTTITAEIIPHYRPTAWGEITSTVIQGRLQTVPMRITGHMFFDASHAPCNHPRHDSKDPKRRSEWEIHPVYAIDVCKPGAACRAGVDSDWIAFDRWIAQP